MAAIIVALLLFVPLHSASHTMRSVNANDVLYVGGSGPGNYTSIQAALDDADNGAAIYVHPGVYNESVVVDKQVFLRGIEMSGEQPVIQAVEDRNAVRIEADGCRLCGFVIKSQEVVVDPENRPACVVTSDHNVLENNTFMYGWCSVYLPNTSYNTLRNNVITKGYMYGLSAEEGYGNVFSLNTANDNMGVGFNLWWESHLTMTGNNATDNLHGFHFTRVSHGTISYNHIYENHQYGVSISGTNLSFINNSIHHHTYVGLQLIDTVRCTVFGNDLYGNQGGVSIEGNLGPNDPAERNVVTRNSIHDNGVGVYLEGFATNNDILDNNIIDNDRSAFFQFSEQPLPNRWKGNYWSDATMSSFYTVKGTLGVQFFVFTLWFPWYQFDMNPATEPYDW